MIISRTHKHITKNTMRKTVISAILLLATGILSACNDYTVDRSYLTQEAREKEEAQLAIALDNYEKSATDKDKADNAFEVGFRYMTLGEYEEAMDYYKIVLEYDAVHFPVLNNMAVMYEELGDIKTALEYEKKLYDNNPTNTEVVSDTIRLLVKNKQFNDAQGVLEKFTGSAEGKANLAFISEQYEYISSERNKAQDESVK